MTTCPIVAVQHCVGWSLDKKNTKYKSAQDVFAGLKYLSFHFILFSTQLDQLNDPGVSLDILAKFGHMFNYTHLFLIVHLHSNHFTSKWTTTVFDKIRKKMNKKDWIWLDRKFQVVTPKWSSSPRSYLPLMTICKKKLFPKILIQRNPEILLDERNN